MPSIWIDGEFVPWENATVHLLSHSMQRGTLVFDYLGVTEVPGRGPAIFRLQDHVARLIESCRLVGLPLRYSKEELVNAIVESVRRYPGAKSIRICAYLSSIEVDVVPENDHVAVAIAAYDQTRDLGMQGPADVERIGGFALRIEREKRNRRPDIVPPQAKVAANYASPMIAKWNARREGFDDILLLDEDGNIAEAPTSTFFMVDDNGVLCTPPTDKILHGISRATVLEVAALVDVPVNIAPISPKQALAAKEAFASSTSAEVLPVGRIDDFQIGDGTIGQVSARIQAAVDDVLFGRNAELGHWLTFV
jgi:branched-chain amino acid aminotransferase